MKTPRTVAIIFSLALLTTGGLTACGAGQDAQTSQPYTPSDGVQGSTGEISIRNVVLIEMPEGGGVLVGSLVNASDIADRLTGVVINGRAATLAPAAPTLEANKLLSFGSQNANASAFVADLGVVAGNVAKVTFTFESAGDATLEVLVREKNEEFAGVTLPNATP